MMACRSFRSMPLSPDTHNPPVDPFPLQFKVESRIQHVGSARLVHNAASVLTNIVLGGVRGWNLGLHSRLFIPCMDCLNGCSMDEKDGGTDSRGKLA